ncbi:hypothetical protein [Parafrigoribacterium humi]|jgi:hypothetical protein|uniref:hypothetical protein n=1 Tax=Parafrigoribacterium humi TaxID=3144664 RepID=UPI0032EAD52C
MTNLAVSLPVESPRGPSASHRHIEIVSTRSQRKARPRAIYALVTVAGLFVILMAQLLLSILLSDGAYQITALQTKQTELSRDAQGYNEQLDVLKSPQNLSARAESLGMVMSTAPAVYLRLSDGAIIGTPTAMKASDAAVVGTGGALIANSLLPALPPMTPTSTNGDAASSAVQGAPGTTTTGGSVASTPGVLPSPVTH